LRLAVAQDNNPFSCSAVGLGAPSALFAFLALGLRGRRRRS
jgi:uncharacterized protein (TIGR03382 family)